MSTLALMLAAAAVEPFPDALAIPADPGRRTVKPSPPTFCSGDFERLEDREATTSKLERLFRLEYYAEGNRDRLDPWEALVEQGNTVARLACSWPGDPEAHRWRAAWEQILVNELRMPDAAITRTWTYLLTRDDDTVEAEAKAARADCPISIDTALPASDWHLAWARHRFVCTHDSRTAKHWGGQAWFADRSESIEVLDRAALVTRFVGDETGQIGVDPSRYAGNGPALAKWLFIREDADALDEGAYRKALEELELTPWMQLNTDVRWYELQRDLERTRAGFAELATSDPRVGELVGAAERGRAGWIEEARANATEMEWIHRAENAWLGVPGADHEGCTTALPPLISARAKSRGATDARKLRSLVHEPVYSGLLTALRRCEEAQGDPVVAAGLESLYTESAVVRGPRTAGVLAAMRTAAELQRAGDTPVRAATLQPWQNSRIGNGSVGEVEPEHDWTSGFPRGIHEVAHGVVATVEDAGAGRSILTFRQEKWEAPIFSCVDTDVIDHVKADGRIIWRRSCTQTGTEWLEREETPLEVDSRAARAVKPGTYVRARRYAYEGQALQGGFVEEVWSDASQSKLEAFAGVPLR